MERCAEAARLMEDVRASQARFSLPALPHLTPRQVARVFTGEGKGIGAKCLGFPFTETAATSLPSGMVDALPGRMSEPRPVSRSSVKSRPKRWQSENPTAGLRDYTSGDSSYSNSSSWASPKVASTERMPEKDSAVYPSVEPCGVRYANQPPYFDVPADRDRTCELTGSEASCSEFVPYINETNCTSFECTGDAWRDLVVVHGCDSEFEDFVRTAWCFLIANDDILRWVSCLVFGKAWAYDLVNKLFGVNTEKGCIQSVYRVEFSCQQPEWGGKDLGDLIWYLATNPCVGGYLALSFTDGFGGFVHFCMDTWQVDKWRTLMQSDCAEDRLCVLIEFASTLAHELTHVVYTARARDTNYQQQVCVESFIFGNTLKWALLKRYPKALAADCCSKYAEVRGGWTATYTPDPALLFYSTEVIHLDAGCAACGT